MSSVSYRFFDSDNHYYEAVDAFTRHLDSRMAPRVAQWVTLDGEQRLLVGGKLNTFSRQPTFDPIWKPGSLREIMRGNNPEALDFVDLSLQLEPSRPEYTNRDARIAWYDQHGVECAFLFPGLGFMLESELATSDPEACVAAFRAFNRWIDEDWGFDYKQRVFALPCLTLIDPADAVRELEWALSRGARAIQIRPGPIAGPGKHRSPGDPVFDPFWARMNEAGVVVGYHGGVGRYLEFYQDWGEPNGIVDFEESAFKEVTGLMGARTISDTIAAMICHGVFARFPNLRVITVENGSDWAPPLLEQLSRTSRMLPKGFSEDPVETFKRHVRISCTPFFDDQLSELASLVGAENILMGSDFPHAEGLADPAEYLKELDGFSPDDVRLIMRDNGMQLLQPPAF